MIIENLSDNKFKVVLLESLRNKLEKSKNKIFAKTIKKIKAKIERMGTNALKPLYVRDEYLLGEVKVKRPPYRLYVIVDNKEKVYYLVDWEHKEAQQKVIEELKRKISLALSVGFERVFGSATD